jgi:protein O-mannosyl-transferase
MGNTKSKRKQKISPGMQNIPNSMGDNSTTRPNGHISRSSLPWLLGIALILLGGLTYWNSFNGKFIFDDNYFTDDYRVKTLWPPWAAMFKWGEGTRPVAGLSFAINYALNGLNPTGYHAMNLGIHLAAGLFLYGILRRTFQLKKDYFRESSGEWLAFIIALVWLVHPLQTSAVTYIYQRCESLMGMFFLASLFFAILGFQAKKARDRSVSTSEITEEEQQDSRQKSRFLKLPIGGWFFLSVICCGLAIGAKQVAVMAPPLILLYDSFYISLSFRKSLRNHPWYYFALACSYLVLTGNFLAVHELGKSGLGFGVEHVTAYQYFLTQFEVVVHYLKLSFWPHPLCLDYLWPFINGPAEVWPQILFISCLWAGTFWGIWRKHFLGYLGAWFFGILSITSSVIPIRDAAFEHRMYLPLAGVISLVFVGFYFLWIKTRGTLVQWSQEDSHFLIKRFPFWAVALIVVGLGWMTAQRNLMYANPTKMWESVLALKPNHGRALVYLAIIATQEGNADLARDYYEKSLAVYSKSAEAHNNYGALIFAPENPDKAVYHLKQAIEINPRYAEAHANLGWAYFSLGQFQPALQEYQTAVDLIPENPDFQLKLGMTLFRLGDYQKASDHLSLSLKIKTNDAESHFYMAVVSEFLGRTETAIQHYQEVLNLYPDSVEAKHNLERLLQQKK